MDKYRDYFEGGIFSTQGKLGLKSGEIYCKVVQINDVQDENSFGKPFINLLRDYDLGWHFIFLEKFKPKIDFFRDDVDHIRHEVWNIIKNSPDESWLIITTESISVVKNLLPHDWGHNEYSNVKIAVVNDEELNNYYLPINVILIQNNDEIDPSGVIISNFGKSPRNSCLWAISGIEKFETIYEFEYSLN